MLVNSAENPAAEYELDLLYFPNTSMPFSSFLSFLSAQGKPVSGSWANHLLQPLLSGHDAQQIHSDMPVPHPTHAEGQGARKIFLLTPLMATLLPPNPKQYQRFAVGM